MPALSPRPRVPAARTDPLWPNGNRPPCSNGDGRPVYLAGLCGACYAAQGEAQRAGQPDTTPAQDGPMNPVPPSISWEVRPGDTIAHAFATGPGWMRSVCRELRWTVALDPATADLERCTSCAILVDGSPGEVSEAFGR